MPSVKKSVKVTIKFLRSASFWIILVSLVGLTFLHYMEELGIGGGTGLHLGLQRHAMERILFLLPIIYTLSIFGVTAGIAISILSLFIMLPRALLWSPDPRDALFEVVTVMLVAGVACLWFNARIRAAEQRKRAEAELDVIQGELQSHIRLARSNEIRLAMLNTISSMLSHSLDLDTLLSNAINMVMEVMEVEGVLIFTVNEQTRELELMAYDGVTEAFVRELRGMKVGEGFNGLVAQSGEPLIVENASRDPRLTREVVKREKIEAELIVPLKTKGDTTGTVCVLNRRPRQFLPSEVQLLTAISNQMSIAMVNARLYREQQVIAAQYRSIFENASDAILVEDLEGNISASNEATANLTGYTREELLRMKTNRILAEDGTKTALHVKSRLLRGDIIGEPYDRRLVRRDGTEVLVRLNSNCIFGDDNPIGFQHIIRDVTKERQVEDNLRSYAKQVTRAQEKERERIARELHDETAQQLIALSHHLEDFARNNKRLAQNDIDLLIGWRDQLKDTIQGVRRFTRDLRPPVLDDLGLVPAVEWLTGELKQGSSMKVDLKVVGQERRLDSEVELTLFRIVQEALTNVRRHAEASSVEVVLEFTKDKIRAIVIDNGKGFELPKILKRISRDGKLGLIGMEERARLLGATITINSELGQGSSITVELPA